jgi:hypothetical protein
MLSILFQFRLELLRAMLELFHENAELHHLFLSVDRA